MNKEYVTVFVSYYKSEDRKKRTNCITCAERVGKKIKLDDEFYEFDSNPIIKTWKEIDDPEWLCVICDDELENANRHHENFGDIYAAIKKYITKGKECDAIRAMAQAMDCSPE